MNNQPSENQIAHWLKTAKEDIADDWASYKSGFYEEEDLAVQSLYTSLASAYAHLARTQFFNNAPLIEVRAAFSQAARHMLKSFTMAYDEQDLDYVGDKWPPKNPHYTGLPDSYVEAKWLDPGYGQVAWGEVSEVYFIEGMNYALMGADFEAALDLARLYQDRPDGRKMDPEVNHYAYALKYLLLGEDDKAAALLMKNIIKYQKRPSKNDYKQNYYTLSTALLGIAEKNAVTFNEGIKMQTAFYRADAKGEYKDTDEEFICDHTVALANLAIHRKLRLTMAYDFLPAGLLMGTESK